MVEDHHERDRVVGENSFSKLTELWLMPGMAFEVVGLQYLRRYTYHSGVLNLCTALNKLVITFVYADENSRRAGHDRLAGDVRSSHKPAKRRVGLVVPGA